MIPARHISPFLAGLCLLSCAGNDPKPSEPSSSGRKTIASYSGGYKVGRNEAGDPVMRSERRSRFDTKRQAPSMIGKDYSGKDYRTAEYRAKRWGGAKTRKRKTYAGTRQATQYQHSPWFVRKTASTTQSRWSGEAYPSYRRPAHSASEDSRPELPHTVHYESDVRRTGYIRAPVRGYKEQKGMSVSETKSILGR